MRGKLIQRFRAAIYRLDTTTTRSSNHYDDVFREPIQVDGDGDGIGALQRDEHSAVYVPCQVGNRKWEKLEPTDLGSDTDSDFVLYFHMYDLEAASLVDATTGRPLIGIGDRLDSIRSYLDQTVVVLKFQTPPGMYCVEATPSGWGLHMAGPKVNLVRAVFRSRSPTGRR